MPEISKEKVRGAMVRMRINETSIETQSLFIFCIGQEQIETSSLFVIGITAGS